MNLFALFLTKFLLKAQLANKIPVAVDLPRLEPPKCDQSAGFFQQFWVSFQITSLLHYMGKSIVDVGLHSVLDIR